MRKSKLLIGAALVVALVALGVGQSKIQEPSVAASNAVMAPHFLVDPYWPKPLPKLMGPFIVPRTMASTASATLAISSPPQSEHGQM